MDGDIDYSKYSAEDLNEALARIDKQRFPVNYANLLKEAASRSTNLKGVVNLDDRRSLRPSSFFTALPWA
jgi:hypothetical protein